MYRRAPLPLPHRPSFYLGARSMSEQPTSKSPIASFFLLEAPPSLLGTRRGALHVELSAPDVDEEVDVARVDGLGAHLRSGRVVELVPLPVFHVPRRGSVVAAAQRAHVVAHGHAVEELPLTIRRALDQLREIKPVQRKVHLGLQFVPRVAVVREALEVQHQNVRHAPQLHRLGRLDMVFALAAVPHVLWAELLRGRKQVEACAQRQPARALGLLLLLLRLLHGRRPAVAARRPVAFPAPRRPC
mmetsp:Transcript_16127/g.37391  ORF Transcript_16127/g.37391 Transcript_16127/m.37391 type:complete len:244 (+) Transcript_16127:138-869(+)